MKSARTIIIMVVIIVLAVFVYFNLREAQAPVVQNSNESPVPVDGQELAYKDLIKVSNLKSGDTIKNPFTLKGEARGTWYFEASFPVRVTDQAGNNFYQTHAEAEADWMTANYVPFSVKLIFSAPAGSSGWIILEKDNPSGDPAWDDSFKIPVKF